MCIPIFVRPDYGDITLDIIVHECLPRVHTLTVHEFVRCQRFYVLVINTSKVAVLLIMFSTCLITLTSISALRWINTFLKHRLTVYSLVRHIHIQTSAQINFVSLSEIVTVSVGWRNSILNDPDRRRYVIEKICSCCSALH